MLKTVIFAILVMLIRPLSAASLMSHEKFVHLPPQQQRQVVVAIMELVVAMEEKYKHEVRTTGVDSEKLRQYKEFFKSVSALLLPEAHAAGERYIRYGQYLSDLSTVLNDKNRCLYGGWISVMVGDLCVHPNYSGNSRYQNYYQAESYCPGREQITCNPAVFGFKKLSDHSLFCVPAGRTNNAADNTSRECMKKALGNSADADSPEVRIQNMVDGIGRNPKDANKVFDFLIQTCACNKNDKGIISDHYMKYMRPHRTCASILRMMATVMPQCPAERSPMDSTQLSLLQNIKESTEATINNDDFENGYKGFIDGILSRDDAKAVCGGAIAPQTQSSTDCVPPKVRMLDNQCRLPCEKPDQDRGADDKCNDKCPGNALRGADGKCPDQAVVIGNTGNTDGQNTDPQKPTDPTDTTNTNPTDTTNSNTTNPTDSTNSNPVTCTDPKTVAVGNECKPLCPTQPAAATTPAAVPGATVPAATPAPANQSTETNADKTPPATPAAASGSTPASTPAPATTPDAPVDPNCVCKDGKHPESGFCEETPPTPDQPAPTTDGATLDVSIKTKAAASYTVLGKISKNPDDYTVIWFKKGNVTASVTSADTLPAKEATMDLSPVGEDA
ncbi:MAG: hypothetical protein ACJ76H_08070, partial [Bacteriovoracaceae bacterium]